MQIRTKAETATDLFSRAVKQLGAEGVKALLEAHNATREKEASAEELAEIELEIAIEEFGDAAVAKLLRDALAGKAPIPAAKSARSPVEAAAAWLDAEGFQPGGVGGFNPFAQPTKKGR